jgi:hypothetical protein
VDVDFGQPFSGGDEGMEVVNKGDAGQFAAEVGGVGFAVVGMVEEGVDVVEDVPFGDG